MYTVGVSLALGTFQDAKINCSSATLLMGVQKITKASEEGPVGSGPLSHDVVRMLHVRCGGSNSLGSTYLGAAKNPVCISVTRLTHMIMMVGWSSLWLVRERLDLSIRRILSWIKVTATAVMASSRSLMYT